MSARAAVAGALGLLVAALAGPAEAGRMVDFASDYPPGAIVISQTRARLYLILDARTAIAYPVAVAKRGQGMERARRGSTANTVEPAWSPPDWSSATTRNCPSSFPAVRRTTRWARGRSRSTATRSRSTARRRTMRASIGTAASYGCIRMLNEDVIDLFDRVAVGAPVVMMQ